MPLACGDFLAYHDVEVVQMGQRLRVKRAFERVVIGDRDDVEVRVVLHEVHDLRNACESVALVRVDMDVGLAPDPGTRSFPFIGE